MPFIFMFISMFNYVTFYQVLLSERPEYNEKIKAGFLMAPVAYLTLATSSEFLLAPYINIIRNLVERIEKYEWFVHRMIYSLFGHVVCSEENHPITENICVMIAENVIGFGQGQLNE